MSNVDRVFLLAGEDITDHVLTAATVPLVKPAWGALPQPAPITLTVRSDDFLFTPWHPVSLLFDRRYDDLDLEIRQAGVTRWKGVVTSVDLEPGGRRASIQGDTVLASRLSRNGRVDTDEVSPGAAIATLLALHEIDTDAESFARAAVILDDIPVILRVRPDPITWAGTLGDLLTALAQAGVGRIHVRPDGLVGFDTWVPPEIGVVVGAELTDDDLVASPETSREEADPAQHYAIQYLYGDTTDADGESDVISLDFGPNAAVQLTTEAAAIYCGSQWVAFHQRRRTVLKLQVHRDVGLWVRDDRWLRIRSTRLATELVGEVVGWDDSDARWITITLHADDRGGT